MKLKSKKPKETIEDLVGQDPIEETSDSKYMNGAEQEVLSADAESLAEEKAKVSTEKMEKAVELLQETFNLSDKGYSVSSFTDGGTKVKIALSNNDFDIAITVKDAQMHGLF